MSIRLFMSQVGIGAELAVATPSDSDIEDDRIGETCQNCGEVYHGFPDWFVGKLIGWCGVLNNKMELESKDGDRMIVSPEQVSQIGASYCEERDKIEIYLKAGG